MGAIRELTDDLWTGRSTTENLNPFTQLLGLEAYRPGLAFVSSFANAVALDTGEGLLLVDTGSLLTGQAVRASIRAWSEAPVNTVVYTHGHIDHVTGIHAFEAEGHPFEVIAHEAVPERFERYRQTAGYNGVINGRQFRMPGLEWPTEYRQPDRVYRESLSFEIGEARVELHHARGETDDHTWLWLPEHRALCTGDLFIWASPNCGNPQKVQRYPREWSEALERMATLGAEILFPGHGPAIEGTERVRQALTETAELLRFLHDETVARMNAGLTLDAIVEEVRAPERLLARPYLRPVYDEPEFVVRNVWRLYGGWWDGDPARLKPPQAAALSREVADLAGGAAQLADRARALSEAGEHALACQLAEWAARSAPDDDGIRVLRTRVYERRAESETSLMSKSIFLDAAKGAG